MRLIIKKLLTFLGVIVYRVLDGLRIVRARAIVLAQKLKAGALGRAWQKIAVYLGFAYKPVKSGYKTAHHHTAGKLHLHLTERWEWYKRWHESPTNSRVMATAAAAYTILVFIGLFGLYRSTFALPDIFETWDFTTPADYTYDSGLEISGTSIRLKAQSYTDDADTAALYHLNETSGSAADDSSSNSNDGTLFNSPSWVTGRLDNGLSLNGSTQFVSAADSASLSLSQKNTLEGWVKFGSAFSANSHQLNQTVLDKGSYRLYFDKGSGKLTYELENNNATWSQTGGNSPSTSWDTVSPTDAKSSIIDGTDLYVGLGGSAANDAEVWKWNGSSWTKIGGDGINSGWATTSNYASVNSMTIMSGYLYVGVGGSTSAANATVWRCQLSANCATWSLAAGLGWGTGFEYVHSLATIGSNVFAGTGNDTAGDAEVYRYTTAGGGVWSKIGGDGTGPLAAHECVCSMTTDGTDLYVGTGTGASDAEVWKWSVAGSSWAKQGGDALNLGGGASWPTGFETVWSMTYFGSNLYVGLGDDAGQAEVWRLNGTTWTQIADTTWGTNTHEKVLSMTNDGTDLYVGLGETSNTDGEVWKYTVSGGTWGKIGGDGTGFSSGGTISSLVYGNSNLYAGFTDSVSAGVLYSYNGSAWTLRGGKYVNSGWGLATAGINAQTYYKGSLYAGFKSGSTTGSALVWKNTSGNNWVLVGGAGKNSSWGGPGATNDGVLVSQLAVYDGELCATITLTSSSLDSIWCYNDSTWTKIGDIATDFTGMTAPALVGMVVLHDKLYVAFSAPGSLGGASTNRLYAYNGTSWSIDLTIATANTSTITLNTLDDTIYIGTQNVWVGIGVQGFAGVYHKTGSGGAWQSAACAVSTTSCALFAYKNTVYSRDSTGYTFNKDTNSFSANAFTMNVNINKNNSTEFNGYLYYILGATLYKFDGTDSTTVTTTTGVGTTGSFTSLTSNLGKLVAGVSNNTVWTLGTNLVVQSTTTSWDTNWHHVAATYDGLTAKVFVDGAEQASSNLALSLSDNNLPLYIGNSLGKEQGENRSSYFAGSLDEIRISDQARSSLNTSPYSNSPQTVRLNDPVRTSGVWHWDTWADNDTANGGTITYRLSKDDGTTWLYWNGSAWATSASTAQANDVATLDANMATFPVSFGGLVWQAILDGDGTQQVTLNEVSASATSDNIEPSTNASNITALKAAGGDSLASGGWTNGSSPYFNWDAGVDSESGVLGYCLYLGTDNTADPVTTKGLLGTGPLNVNSGCQFAISTDEIDLSTAGYIGTALTSSSSSYYFTVKTIDNAGNITTASTQFNFKFDNTTPENPAFVSAPSGFVANKTIVITWPTAGGDAASDSHSGVVGLQYRINNGTWYGDSHSGSGDITDLLNNDGSYTTVDPPDFDDLNEGVNTIYFRTWDTAGNVTTSYKSAALRINTTGAPSEPQNLDVTPDTNTVNSFAFDWDAPDTYNGTDTNIVYCYTVNTTPSAGTCTWTQPGVTSLAAGAYATQPGSNTFYVVAKDESGAVNYATYSSVTFTANTSAPGIPLNLDITDVSVRATNNWRLATTWEEPVDPGSGVASYRIYRSTDNITFAQVGTSTNPSFVDAGLNQVLYYYKVRACDSANNCGAYSSTVSETPTGKFTSPATLTSNPEVSGVTTHKATVNWTTDRASDSRIAFGTSSGNYAAAEIVIGDQVTDHEIELDNLSAGTTYYAVAKWTDQDGNTGTSSEFNFKTDSAPSLKEITTSKITTNSAVITFTSESTTRVKIFYGKTDSFGSSITINTSQAESTYTANLTGLSDGTKYFYRLISYDSENFAYEGSIFAFNTLPTPRITNLRFQPIDGEPTSTQKVTWDTNVASTSQVTYGQVGTEGDISAAAKLVTKHEIIIRELKDNTNYFLVAQSRDAAGNVATSDRQVFKTGLDTRPPEITDITVETSIRGTGADARGQIIVSWKTDEPSTSQVGYAPGSNAAEFTNKTSEDSALATEHIVIISDLPTSRVFTVAPISGDDAKNYAEGEGQPAIIGRASDSVLTIILNTLRSVFGF